MRIRISRFASLVLAAALSSTIASLSACTLPGELPRDSCVRSSWPTLAACLISPQAGFPANVNIREAEVAIVKGVVTEVGTGAAPENCFEPYYPGARQNNDDNIWVRFIDEDDNAWVAALSSEFAGPSAFPTVGEAISVDYALQYDGFDSYAGHLTVRNEAGALLGWVNGSGGFYDANVPEEIGLIAGEATCTVEEECGTWQLYEMALTFGGATTSLSDSESQEFGGMNFVYAGHRQTTSFSDQCDDWGFGYLIVGAFAP